MAITVFLDAPDDDTRRERSYQGGLHLTPPTATTEAFVDFTRELIVDAFSGLDPETAQHQLPISDYADILAALKPRFIHHPESKRFLREILIERGCDPELTYFDVPRLRTSTSDGYLTTGIAYAWHPHRDTWYSAPMAQLNHWMPVYAVRADNAMAFHPEHFARAVPNDSAKYNYYEWNAKYRAAAASNIGTDSRPLPGPNAPVDLGSSTIYLPPVGGMVQFSAQHLHSSVPNTSGYTRFSIDFRTVHIGDVRSGREAPNVDCACTGSSIRDFLRTSDLQPVPADVVALFNDGTENRGELVYQTGT